MNWTAEWIKPCGDIGDIVPVFGVDFQIEKKVLNAKLFVTAMGIYEAKINDQRISDYVLAPGWTTYTKRLQYQEYDITEMLSDDNHLRIYVGKGWYRGRMPGWEELRKCPAGVLAQLEIAYIDGSTEIIATNDKWNMAESEIRFSDIYDGEIYNANIIPVLDKKVEVFDGPFNTLILQEGEKIREQEVLYPIQVFTSPNGETIVDFGQEITGYVEVTVKAKSGEVVDLSCGEVLDKYGIFYNANYRSAKGQYQYICKEGMQTYHPRLTFYGFRYIRINEFPGGCKLAKPENFKAIAVYSDMRRTGYLSCSDPLLNRLFDNIIWGQKCNFLDIPTDCPQRDERWGWTGDAQVFVRTACLNFDTEKFYKKWLADLAVEQGDDGCVPRIIPDLFQDMKPSAAWGDAAVICPWRVYLAYGNKEILKAQFQSMKKWVDYISARTTVDNLWIGCEHYGDWLGLDAPSGSYKGSSRDDLIASAYYAYSTELVVKAGKVLGEDISGYEKLYANIVKAFQKEFPEYRTQTECALAVYFRLAEDCQAVADQLAYMVQDKGNMLQTGFVGTPYLLHALSDYGHSDIAYSLLLRKEYPSWLYSVTKGATTIWEHWDGIMENGDFWSTEMNSFNHYAYGAVADWVYCVAAGINTVEEYPGYEKVRISPNPDVRLDWLKASLETRHGLIISEWKKEECYWRYEITTPVDAEIVIDGITHVIKAGSYLFYSKLK